MMVCESGWTGDRCQLPLGHEGPHDNEDGTVREHRGGLHADAYVVDCRLCREEEAPFDAYREPEGGAE